MATVTKKDLIESVALATGQPRTTVKPIVQAFLEESVNTLGDGNRIELRDFGVFEVRTRKPRTARNPKTADSVKVPARAGIRFKPGRLMKESIQKTTK